MLTNKSINLCIPIEVNDYLKEFIFKNINYRRRVWNDFVEEAKKFEGKQGDNFLVLLESRLDNLVYRLGLATTRRQARQLVNHGHILVDGKKVDIPSYLCKPGQTICLKETSKGLAICKEALENTVARVPYVQYDEQTGVGTFVRMPERSEFLPEIKENLIVEFYNR